MVLKFKLLEKCVGGNKEFTERKSHAIFQLCVTPVFLSCKYQIAENYEHPLFSINNQLFSPDESGQVVLYF
jgi:hypothetical protein